MSTSFNDKSILIALDNPSIMKILIGIFKILCFKEIHSAQDGGQAFQLHCAEKPDLIITELDMSPQNGRYLIKKIRDQESGSPNTLVPVLLNTGNSGSISGDELRALGFTDLLLSPFSVNDIKSRLSYIFENYPNHEPPPAPEQPVPEAPPVEGADSKEEEDALVKTLLGHYMQHHEAVLQKLRFAQDATLQSIQEVRAVGEDLKDRDNTNLHEFSRFEKMWEEIIQLFLKGGLSEDDIFKIEDAITNIPDDIKKHYNQLTQQDKSFLTLIEAMNHDAYRKARAVAVKVQEAPNPMTGMTQSEYKAKSQVQEASFVFRPSKK